MRWFRVLLLALTVSTTLLQADEPPKDDPAKPAEGPETPIVSGKLQLLLDPGGEIGSLNSVLFSPDGKQLITAANSGIRFRDVVTGQTLRILRPPWPGPARALALSADGRRLAIAGNLGQPERVPAIAVMALADGRVERLVKMPPNSSITSVALSPDGKLAVSSWLGTQDRALRLWDLTRDEPPSVINLEAPAPGLSFSPDSKRLLEGSAGPNRIWDVTTGMLATQFGEKPRLPGAGIFSNAVWSPDGKTLATWCAGNGLNLWEPDGTLRHPLFKTQWPFGAMFTADSRHMLVAIGNTNYVFKCRLVTVDVQTGKEEKSIDMDLRLGYYEWTRGQWLRLQAAFSPRGDLAVSILQNRTLFPHLILWKCTDGSILHHFNVTPWLGKGSEGPGVGWSPDGKSIAWWKNLPNTRKPFPEPGREVSGKGTPAAFDLEGLQFVPPPAEADRHIRVLKQGSLELRNKWIFKDDKRFSEFKGIFVQGGDPRSTLVGQDRAAVVPWDGTGGRIGSSGVVVSVFDVNTGKLLHQLRHEAVVTALAVAPGRPYLATSDEDQILRLWNAETGKRLLSLFVAGQEWILWTDEGYYAASPGGEKLMGWLVDNGSEQPSSYHPAQRFRKDFYRPDVIKLVMEKGSVEEALKSAGIKQAKQLEEVLPPTATLRFKQEGAKVAVEVLAQAGSRSQPVSELQLLVDGRPARLENGQLAVKTFAPPVEKDAKGEWGLTLEPGLHKLSVRATARDTYSISEEVIADVPVPMTVPRNNKQGTLHYLGIGVNQFQYEPELKLTGAVPDVLAMEKCLKETCKVRFSEIKPTVLTDEKVTRQVILETLTELQGKLKPTDVVIVHYSSHGEVEEGGLFLLCHDSKRGAMKTTAVPGEKLRDVLGQYPCPVLLILDACHSGKFPLLRPPTDPLSRMLADDSCGVAVMTAALAHQKAIDTEKGGLFTQALVEGLSGKADPDKVSKQLYVHHLFTYVFDSVARQTANKQMPLYLPSGSVPPIVLKEAETK